MLDVNFISTDYFSENMSTKERGMGTLSPGGLAYPGHLKSDGVMKGLAWPTTDKCYINQLFKTV
jgi:hypothetical protein